MNSFACKLIDWILARQCVSFKNERLAIRHEILLQFEQILPAFQHQMFGSC